MELGLYEKHISYCGSGFSKKFIEQCCSRFCTIIKVLKQFLRAQGKTPPRGLSILRRIETLSLRDQVPSVVKELVALMPFSVIYSTWWRNISVACVDIPPPAPCQPLPYYFWAITRSHSHICKSTPWVYVGFSDLQNSSTYSISFDSYYYPRHGQIRSESLLDHWTQCVALSKWQLLSLSL